MELGLIHAPLAGYFGLIAYLAATVTPKVFRTKQTTASLAFLGLAATSLLVTWTYMGLYFQHSYRAAALERGVPPSLFSTKQWLEDVSLFNEAWGYVCDKAERWWWSEQLCYWTVGPLAMLFAIEGRRRGVKKLWAFMLLGQVVAISFAQSLFFAAVALTPVSLPRAPARGQRLGPPPGQTWLLVGSAVLGAIGTCLIPARVSTPYFLPLLLGIHVFSVLPMFDSMVFQKPIQLPPSRFYFNFAFIALRLRWDTLAQLVDTTSFTTAPREVPALVVGLLRREANVLVSHPAQSSISFDVVFASLSAVVFMWYDKSIQPAFDLEVPTSLVALLTVATPIVGVQSSVGMYLAIREGKREAREQNEMRLAQEEEEDDAKEGKKDK
ncbi:hypothetical protein JCM10212_004168 [Sporobolomyces blumeae]